MVQSAMVGLGLIGSAWCEHLQLEGVLVAAWNRSPKTLPYYVSDLAQIPTQASIIHIVVADEAAVGAVLAAIAPKLSKGNLVIQSSTIDPQSSDQFQALVQSKGARYLEAPFTGSLPAAQERKTIFYCGGDSGSVEEAIPYLRLLSQHQFVIGSNRQACMLKLAMNLQIVSAVEALCEALTIARGAGISDQIFFDAFRVNASFSGVAALKEPKLRGSDYAPQFSVKHMSKDMRLLLKAVADAELPALKMVRKQLLTAEHSGRAELDFCALIEELPRSSVEQREGSR